MPSQSHDSSDHYGIQITFTIDNVVTTIIGFLKTVVMLFRLFFIFINIIINPFLYHTNIASEKWKHALLNLSTTLAYDAV